MGDITSHDTSNLLAEARGVLERNRDRWPAADWQTLDRFVSEIESFVDDVAPMRADDVDAALEYLNRWTTPVDTPTRTIETVEQLDELPIGSVVRSLGGTDIGDIYVNWADHHLASLYGPWYRSGYEVPCPSDEVDLPGVVLYRPERDQ